MSEVAAMADVWSGLRVALADRLPAAVDSTIALTARTWVMRGRA
jgi:hypothetical protein